MTREQKLEQEFLERMAWEAKEERVKAKQKYSLLKDERDVLVFTVAKLEETVNMQKDLFEKQTAMFVQLESNCVSKNFDLVSWNFF